MPGGRPVLEAGAGRNIVRTDPLSKNWTGYGEKLIPLPRVRDASNNPIVTKYVIQEYVYT